MTHDTREGWLTQACQLLAPTLQTAGVQLDLGTVRVSCGWPARGALAVSKRRIGECWPGEVNSDGNHYVFVSPVLDQPVEVIATLLHELLHAALPAKVKHGKKFATLAEKCGLEGKPTSTVAGQALTDRVNVEMLPALGAYPHTRIDASLRPKQTTRMRLYECQCDPEAAKAEGRSHKVRAATDNLLATCNVCMADFVKVEVN